MEVLRSSERSVDRQEKISAVKKVEGKNGHTTLERNQER